ncbi:MAG TPA: ABC transporter substrate-binding protein [Methylomirabilota bacterium]|nr:ABC transporter substrate-binding protein [Methylomirabilota bacterium]
MRLIGLAVVLALSLALAPLAAEAQQPASVPRIGVLFASTPDATSHLLDGLRQGLREHGYVEGQHIMLERRYGQAGVERMSDLAAELVRIKVRVIVAATDPATAAVRQQTQTIPIVMANSTDPVGTGFVASLARPSGNVTGLSALSPELSGKRLGLLREVVPGLARVAIIWNPDVRGALFDYKETEAAARSMRLQLQSVEVSRGEDLDRAFSAVTNQRAQALIVQTPNPVLFANRSQVASFAQRTRLPSMYGQKEFADAGGLMSYGASTTDLFRRAATYVDKILKGAKPADLPVEQPTKFELVINLKTAKTLGLTIPQTILLQADQVIQ